MSPDRARPLRWLVPAAAVVVLAAVALGVWLLPERNEAVAPSLVQPERQRTPSFAFDVAQRGALPTTQLRIRRPVRGNPILPLRGASKLASTKAIASVTRLYRAAFLDPANWQTGNYGDLWSDFSPGARVQARGDVRAMTAGTAAGEAYVAILPRPSRIGTTILLDRNRKPAIVLASARFRALGRTIAGDTNTRFESVGRFFFQRIGGAWKIVSYDVERHDRKVDRSTSTTQVAPTSPSTEAG